VKFISGAHRYRTRGSKVVIVFMESIFIDFQSLPEILTFFNFLKKLLKYFLFFLHFLLFHVFRYEIFDFQII